MIPSLEIIENKILEIVKGEHIYVSINNTYVIGVILTLNKYRVECVPRVYISSMMHTNKRFFHEIEKKDIHTIRFICENVEDILDVFKERIEFLEEQELKRQQNIKYQLEQEKINKAKVEEIDKCCMEKLKKLGLR